MSAWSFSGMKVFETCPRKYHAEKVAKLYPFTETEATRFGTDVHKAAEEYIRDGKPLPENYEKFKKVLDSLNNIEGEKHCEIEMALTVDKQPTDFKSPDAWVRGIADLLIINGETAFVVDYKTGSAKYPDKKQLELMALMVFKRFPEVQRVKAALVFLVHDVIVKAEYIRKDEERLWSGWEAKAALLNAAYEHDRWPPKPNGLCRKWCPVDHCEYSGD